MSTPGDGRAPDERDLPDPARPYAEPSGRAPDPKTPYAGSPHQRSPYGGPPDPAAEPPYVYNPYGNYPYPASYPASPGRRTIPTSPPSSLPSFVGTDRASHRNSSVTGPLTTFGGGQGS